MKMIKLRLAHLVFFVTLLFISGSMAQSSKKSNQKINVFVLGSTDKNHSPMVKKAEPMFQKMAGENNFDIHFTRDTNELTPFILSKYDVFIQLSIAYFDFSRAKQFAIQQFISSGKGWVGIHGAGLTGPQFASKDGIDWKWYWRLLGNAYYIPHPPLQQGNVNVVNRDHPITKNLPASFSLRDEWYEFENAPSNVTVLAVADESTYKPKKAMGYHPVIWTNPDYNRVVYISVGHDSTSCESEPYKILLRDAIKWAAGDQGGKQKQMAPDLDKEASIITLAGYKTDLPKKAMFKSKFPVSSETNFKLIEAMTLEPVYTGNINYATPLKKQHEYWQTSIDFSDFNKPGFYKIELSVDNKIYSSVDFEILKQQLSPPKIKVVVLAERGEIHESFVVAGLEWLNQYNNKAKFDYTVITNTDTISTAFLNDHKLFIQLNYPPYRWSDQSKAAFEDYIDQGKGAWIGFHHASLLGEFDGYPMWNWFSDFLGGIRFKNYVAKRVDGEVYLEEKRHPIFRNVPSHFNLPGEEWYTFDKNPRANAQVLATVDENSYRPSTDIKMGDHPVIWSNPKKKAKNVYFLFGHHGGLFESKEFKQLFANSIEWAVK